jgi:diadenosine tetraphosphate (Ap4A) HIT family hydrolase
VPRVPFCWRIVPASSYLEGMHEPATPSHPPSTPPGSSTEGCPFCRIPAQRTVAVSEHGVAFPDAFPVTPGHMLVIPRIHVGSLFDLPQGVQADLWHLVARVRHRLAGTGGVEGFTVGTNDGRAAGQTVPHAHIHVIPRRGGDVADPRGGVRWVVPERAAYWSR